MKTTRGICKLTGSEGKFVRSHLIPKALTRPSVRGNRFIQFGQNSKPKTIWDSWYDSGLVTREGERILSDYDSWAIHELRRLKLIWQSWGSETSFINSMKTSPSLPSFGLRKLICENPVKFRLFFLSLLWRAAATNRTEFSDIQLDKKDLNCLKRMVRDGDPNPLSFYPTALLQIASKGPQHNCTPSVHDVTYDKGDGTTYRHNVFRFYFDGLIANTHRSLENAEEAGALIVGFSPELVVQMQLYDESSQNRDLTKTVVESIITGIRLD